MAWQPYSSVVSGDEMDASSSASGLSPVEERFASAWASEDGEDRAAAFKRVCVAAGVTSAEGVKLRRRYRVIGRVNMLKDGMLRAMRISWRALAEKAKLVLYEAMEGGEDIPMSVRVTAAKTSLDIAVKAGVLGPTLDDAVPLGGGVDAAVGRLVGLDGGKAE